MKAKYDKIECGNCVFYQIKIKELEEQLKKERTMIKSIMEREVSQDWIQSQLKRLWEEIKNIEQIKYRLNINERDEL